ncbi:hypothetical protein L1887_18565 [Cichorium endivia]|nr:hypothetical protein L1887_18565 [Cichorium endivia]
MSHVKTEKLGMVVLDLRAQIEMIVIDKLGVIPCDNTNMTTEKSQVPSVTPPAMDSCRKKKSDDATFLEDVKDHIDEFINASMDEHKTCFKKTISKMFGMSKVVAERNAAENKGIESSLPLRTVVSD